MLAADCRDDIGTRLNGATCQLTACLRSAGYNSVIGSVNGHAVVQFLDCIVSGKQGHPG